MIELTKYGVKKMSDELKGKPFTVEKFDRLPGKCGC